MAKLVISDTAEAIITDLSTGKVIMSAEMQLADISGTIQEEDLFGGIGNKRLFKIRNQKMIDVNMRSAVVDTEYWALTQGVEVLDGTATVTRGVMATVTDDGGTLSATIPNAPVGLTTARFTDLDGSQEEVAVTSGKATIPALSEAVAGDKVQLFYKEEVEGRSITFDSTKFSNKVKLELRTIAYDLLSGNVASDIYFIFDEALPNGEFSIGLENGSVLTPEITFSIVNPIGVDKMGEMIEVPRA